MSGRKRQQAVDPKSRFSTHDCGPTRDVDRIITFIPKLGGMCLHQNLEEGFQRLESSQNHDSKGSIACRSKPADSDAALELAFFRQRQQINDGSYDRRWDEACQTLQKGKDQSPSYLKLGMFSFFCQRLQQIMLEQDSCLDFGYKYQTPAIVKTINQIQVNLLFLAPATPQEQEQSISL